MSVMVECTNWHTYTDVLTSGLYVLSTQPSSGSRGVKRPPRKLSKRGESNLSTR